MSIRLVEPTQIAGAHVAVDGATLYLTAALEAVLVGKRAAVYVDAPKQDNGRMFASFQKSAAVGGVMRQDPVFVPTVWAAYAVGIPFVIPPGDGGSNGLIFSGTAGAFTLSAAVLSGLGSMLPGCYMYLTANFGGLTIPAGWYWTEWSSDTAGIVYAETYTTGLPRAPTQKTALSSNASGRLTTTTAEVFGPTGLTIAGGSLGPNGGLNIYVHQIANNSADSKSVYVYAGVESIFQSNATTAPVICMNTMVQNQGVQNKQSSNRGVGTTGVALNASNYSTLDTSSAFDCSASLKLGAKTSGLALISLDIFQFYGA
jgi:hypothetical protein